MHIKVEYPEAVINIREIQVATSQSVNNSMLVIMWMLRKENCIEK